MNDPILSALAAVGDPRGGDIVGTGRVAAPRLKEGTASLVLDVTGLTGEERGDLERQVKEAVSRVPGVSEVRVAMTAD